MHAARFVSFVTLTASALSCAAPKTAIEKDPAPSETTSVPAPERQGGAVAAAIAPATESTETKPAPSAPVAPKLDTPRPSAQAKAWESADAIDIANKRCEAKRIGEWVRLKCDEGTSSIAQLAGEPRGVTFGCWNVASEPRCVVFPLRPGDRRVFQFNQLTSSGGWGDSAFIEKEALASAWWPKAAESPRITVD